MECTERFKAGPTVPEPPAFHLDQTRAVTLHTRARLLLRASRRPHLPNERCLFSRFSARTHEVIAAKMERFDRAEEVDDNSAREEATET